MVATTVCVLLISQFKSSRPLCCSFPVPVRAPNVVSCLLPWIWGITLSLGVLFPEDRLYFREKRSRDVLCEKISRMLCGISLYTIYRAFTIFHNFPYAYNSIPREKGPPIWSGKEKNPFVGLPRCFSSGSGHSGHVGIFLPILQP